MKIVKKNNGHFEKSFFWLVITFVFIGLLAIADSSAPQALDNFGDKYYFLKQQVFSAFVGLVSMLIVANINYNFWKKIATPLFFLSILLLLIVLIPHFGIHALGARRWIDLGFVSFQPSELVKFSLAVYLAKLASSNKKALAYFIPLLVVLGLIMLQPDLGTALVVSIIGFSQIFLSGVSILYFLGALISGVLGVIILILFSPYRRERLLTFFETTRDPLGKGYHIRQILLGLGSGGLLGVGLGESRQKFLFLPEASTDSIFAIIAEELGFVGSLILIILFVYFIVKVFKIASQAPDKFSQILVFGIASWIGGQAFLNIASMVSLVPLTGIPLPFISYGGTSLIALMTACGIVLNISRFATIKK